MPNPRRGRAAPGNSSEHAYQEDAPPKNISDDQPEEPSFLKALRDLNVGELRHVAAFAEARIREREAGEKAALKARLLKEMQDSGFTPTDLFGEIVQPAKPGRKPEGAKSKAERGPLPVKYRGPNPENTWSGRGRPPDWLKALVAEGHPKEDYLVERPAAA